MQLKIQWPRRGDLYLRRAAWIISPHNIARTDGKTSSERCGDPGTTEKHQAVTSEEVKVVYDKESVNSEVGA